MLDRKWLLGPGILLGLAAWCIASPQATSDEPRTLEARIESVLATPAFRTADWGLLVVDGKTGAVVYERNADRLYRPASVTKLFSTAAALVELGPDFRFQTAVKRRGVVDASGTLQGDLILVASGDMALGGRTGPDGTMLFTDSDHSYAGGSSGPGSLVSIDPMAPLAGLDALAREIQSNGIRAVTGDVIVDDRLYEAAPSTGSGPDHVSPVMVNDNLIDVLVAPGARSGDPASVTLLPQSAFLTLDARVVTSEKGVKASIQVLRVGPRSIQVRGTIPLEHSPLVETLEMTEPADFARALLIECLRRRGVDVSASPLGSNRRDALPSPAEVAALERVAEYTSPPFREYLKVILKVSQNLHASTLPMLLAARQERRTLADGLSREGELLKGLGVDLATISFGGGAGGSGSDLVTPRATVSLLRAMAKRPDFPVYEAALPVLGRDGTLSKAVSAESQARGHARAKTGTYWVDNALTGRTVLTSKALAGYMETAAGRPLVFAFFLNDVCLESTSADVTAATTLAGQTLGRLCEAFYDDKPAATSPTTPPPPSSSGAEVRPAGPSPAPPSASLPARPPEGAPGNEPPPSRS
jgi:D-alanyl-D-alanine carboxypeptidase/D-alanyl-D-alanine-endopeptidase (penicillin-binding protein 4)